MATNREVYVLGGYQTDFARNWTKENKHFSALMREGGARRARSARASSPTRVEVGARRQLRRRALLHAGPPRRVLRRGAIPRSAGCPRRVTRRRARRAASRCSPRSAEIEAGWYDLSCVVGIEQMKTVPAVRGRRLPRHRGLVRAGGQGRRVPVPEALRQARRRVRQALRAQGRVPRRDQRDQLREREAEPARADAHLVHEQGARAVAERRQPRRRRAHPHLRLLAGHRRRGVRVPRVARVRGEVRQGPRSSSSRASRASRAGATTPRACASSTRSPRAAATRYVLPHVRATITVGDGSARASPTSTAIDGIETHDCFTTSRVHGDRPLRHHAARRELEGRSKRAGSRSAASTRSTRAAA